MTKEEKALCSKGYYTKNREKIAAKKLAYYLDNKESICAQNKIYSVTRKGKYKSYKAAAKTRNLSFDLSFEEFISFWEKPCSYCGLPIETVGIDRINSDAGYIISNCKSCCVVCNRMKLDHSEVFWIEHINRVLNHLKKE